MRGRSIRVIGIILVLFVCMFGLSGKGVHVAAQDTAASGDKIYGDYSYQVLSDGNISISKYNGNASEVHVPEMIDGKKVTEIGKDA
ncbi:MAG: hypothetical protein Q4G58_04345, partial [bacterium]|nr:hypothetical protein [bacterium]